LRRRRLDYLQPEAQPSLDLAGSTLAEQRGMFKSGPSTAAFPTRSRIARIAGD
jgi:hypothetical protein